MLSDFSPIDKNTPTVFGTGGGRQIDVRHLLELARHDELGQFASDLDEALLMMVDYLKHNDGTNGEWFFDLYWRIRYLRNALLKMEWPTEPIVLIP